MKKSLLIFGVLVFLLIAGVFAQDALPEEIKELEKVTSVGDDIASKGLELFIKQSFEEAVDWINSFFHISSIYSFIDPVTDPVFNFFLKITPEVSWLFLVTLLLWIAIAKNIFQAFEFVPMFSKRTSRIISIGIIIILSVLGVAKFIAEYIIEAIALLPNWWLQLIAGGVVVIALLFASIFSKGLQSLFKGYKEKTEEEKEAENRKKLEANVKASEEFTKGLAGQRIYPFN